MLTYNLCESMNNYQSYVSLTEKTDMATNERTEETAGNPKDSAKEARIEKKAKKSKIRNAAQKDESSITFYLHASLFLFFL